MTRRGESFLEAANRIGRALVRSAYWDSDHRLCNWVGRSTRERMADDAPVVPTVAALGPDLYGGSSGVALFLAQLAAITDDDLASSTATAACANALRNVERLPVGEFPAMSFHGGLIGVAFACHRIVALTGDSHDLATRADAMLERAAEAVATPHVLDVIGGNAGAILALLALGRSLCRPALLELATMLGDELIEVAERQGDAWSWHPERTTGPGTAALPLTGLAHGASGLGVSLLELHAATGRGDFLEAGRGAFCYEDTLFNEAEGNWPDLRAPGPGKPAPTASNATYAMAWCHGAPGIALARARAATLDPARRDLHEAMARAALATTLESMDRFSRLPRVDVTLCHGLAGLAEIALTAGRWLNNVSIVAAAIETSRRLIERHSAAQDWVSGLVSGGPNPSLMLGSSGIGWHFLRQHDSERVPTPLWVAM
jgi:lantibiotic modifying enzyme